MKSWRLGIAAVAGVSTLAAGQCCPGHLSGKVTSASGLPIVNAEITAHCHARDGDRDLTARTDAHGKYHTGQLTWEPCDVEIIAPGFAIFRQHIIPTSERDVEVNAHLVSAEKPKVQA